jgi:hypothetical protein
MLHMFFTMVKPSHENGMPLTKLYFDESFKLLPRTWCSSHEIIVKYESNIHIFMRVCTKDITMQDTRTPRPSPRYKSSPTQLPRSVRIQPTPLHSFGVSPIAGIETRRIRMCWKGDNDVVVLVGSQLQKVCGSFYVTTTSRCVTFLGQFGHVLCRALSPS